MSWIERILNKSNVTPARRASIPEGVWTKCDSCGQVLYRAELERNLEVCPKCDHHMRMHARERLNSLLDQGTQTELGSELEPKDILKFRDSKKYKDRLAAAQKETEEKDALIVMKGQLHGMPVVAAAFEFAFMGGSMGSVVGARFVRAVEQALEDVPQNQRPVLPQDRVREDLVRRLDDIETRVNHISIPLAYADELYRLRSHIDFVRERVRATLEGDDKLQEQGGLAK